MNGAGNHSDKVDDSMLAKNETHSGLSAEMSLIPRWAWGLAVIVFLIAQIFFNVALARRGGVPPAAARAVIGLFAGLAAGCYVLFIGYINRDAKRRGMSSTLWTLVAILIPNALGILLYFVLRQPLQAACPQCGNAIQTGFNFCPRCSYKLSPSCPQCQRVVNAHDVYCPYCGTSVRDQGAAGQAQAVKQQ
jgi:RNA polymerase subunit RPABC4/transcription elongation factor Spt4